MRRTIIRVTAAAVTVGALGLTVSCSDGSECADGSSNCVELEDDDDDDDSDRKKKKKSNTKSKNTTTKRR